MARLYEVLIAGSMISERWNLRLNYVSQSTEGVANGSALLARALGLVDSNETLPGVQLPTGSVFQSLQAMVTNNVLIDRLDVLNVYDPVDFFSTPIAPPLVGGRVEPSLPTFVAFKFASTVVRRDIRPGQKAVPGVGEGMQDNGSLAAAATPLVNAFATALGATITATVGGVTDTFLPCIVSKVRYAVPDRGTFAYRYRPATGAGNQFDFLAVGIQWAARPQVSSQNSRKPGRGI